MRSIQSDLTRVEASKHVQASAADEVTKKATGSVLMREISCPRDNSDVMPRARLAKTMTVAGLEISSAAGGLLHSLEYPADSKKRCRVATAKGDGLSS